MFFKRDKSAISLGQPFWVKISIGVATVFVVLMIGLSWYWSRMPDVFYVTHKTKGESTLVGYSTADTLVRVASTMLEKPGGFLSNDRMPPGVFLDNIPNWEFGVPEMIRHRVFNVQS